MSQFDEFIPTENHRQLKEENHENRQHVRLSLRKRENENLALACDGVTVTLLHKNWLQSHKLGIANIKDIGFGGVGLITAISLDKGQEVYIDIDGYRMLVKISRTKTINSKLNFLGARWISTDEEKIISMINKIQPALI
ncbi:type IV pilus assembly PilZ [Shewanella sediminis HAW-EB3]|uniref:Type IV pilus assembly PilZ n=1 Tax=Shewanella sediminis (strain HAW-EB3) TaxID=425104 RepID=A8FP88_SHESH|nr:hypothetical protein [Shewanella sediminis]ABV34661.1 type IV pilus assembly PilZ [Shewanella sediminis HAW-EB3]